MKTQNIPASIIKDAQSVTNGLYRMNARNARGYAFCCHENGKEVAVGEFIWFGETHVNSENFDGYIDFKQKTLTDLQSNETINLEKKND